MSEKPKNDDSSDISGQSGGKPPRSTTQPEPKLTVPVHVTPEELAAGVEKEVVYQWANVCEHCNATGSEPGSLPAGGCSGCQGTGEVRSVKQSFIGFIVQTTPCPVCKGAGKRPSKPCRECQGRAFMPQNEIHHLTIPASTLPGAQFVVKGMGNARQSDGARGDITFVIDVATGSLKDSRKKKKKNDEGSFFDRLKGLFGLDE